MTFKDTLATLPAIDNIQRIELLDNAGQRVATIENQPGKQGSLAVYNALLLEFGEINPDAAEKGLTLFAEHTEDARNNPGKHPNIDRLFAIIKSGESLQFQLITTE